MRDKRDDNPKKTVQTPEVIASVEALIPSDRRITEAEIEEETGLSHGTIHKILSEDLRLVKKTCLLYTSPSPRDRQKSRMPSSA